MDWSTAWREESRAMILAIRDLAMGTGDRKEMHDALAMHYLDALHAKLPRKREEMPSSVNVACVVSHAALNVVLHPNSVSFTDISGFMASILKDRGVKAPGKQRIERVARSIRSLACEGVHEPVVMGDGDTIIQHCATCLLVLARGAAVHVLHGDGVTASKEPVTGPAMQGPAMVPARRDVPVLDDAGTVIATTLVTIVQAPWDAIAAAVRDAIKVHETCKDTPGPGDDSTIAALASSFLGHGNLSDVARAFPVSRSTLSNRVLTIAKAGLDVPSLTRVKDIDFLALRRLASG